MSEGAVFVDVVATTNKISKFKGDFQKDKLPNPPDTYKVTVGEDSATVTIIKKKAVNGPMVVDYYQVTGPKDPVNKVANHLINNY